MKWSRCAIVLGLILSGCGAMAQPEEPAKPAEAMKPAQASEPMTPAAPRQPAKPAEPAGAAQPSQPISPATPKAAKVAALAVPAEDLVGQADQYLAAIEEGVATADAYNDSKEDLARQANTLIVIVWALGQYDRSGTYRDLAPILAAAGDLAAAKDYASASGAASRLKTAIQHTPELPVAPPATAPASLAQLMKEVPILNTKLKRNVQGQRLTAKAKETAGYSAVLAAIAQASDGSKEAAKTPQQVAQWHKFCLELRDGAVAANAAIHAGQPQATAAAMGKLASSCHDCHAVFLPKEAGGE
jgi:hypothetical protein